MRPTRVLLFALVVTVASWAAPAGAATVSGAYLDGATVTSPLTVTVTNAGTSSVKWVLDGTYVGESKHAPFAWTFTPGEGTHVLKFRPVIGGFEQRREDDFVVDDRPPATFTAATSATLALVLPLATPGDVIQLADGAYTVAPALLATVDGTAANPVMLRGGPGSVVRDAPSGGIEHVAVSTPRSQPADTSTDLLLASVNAR